MAIVLGDLSKTNRHFLLKCTAKCGEMTENVELDVYADTAEEVMDIINNYMKTFGFSIKEEKEND